MEERFTCPHCGKELTEIALELDKFRKKHDELQLVVNDIIASVFDAEELGSIADRQD